MENKVSFGRFEATTLLVNAICVQIFLSFPRIMAQEGATAGWILVFYNSILVLFLFILIIRLFSRFEGMDLLDISENIGGSVARILIGSLIMLYFAFITSLILREFGEGIKVVALPESPLNFVILLFMVGLVGSAYFGLESIVRFHAIIIPLIMVGLLIVLFGVSPHYNFDNLYPVLGTGAYSIFVKSIDRISTFSALIILFMITPFIKTVKNLKIVGFITITTASVFLIMATVVFLAVIPYPAALESEIPIYQMARLIDIPRIFERVESVFIIIWTAAVLLFLSAGFYFLVYVFKRTFKLTYYKPLILPFAILILSLSHLLNNDVSTIHLKTKYFSHFSWIVSFGLPLLLLGASYILRMEKRRPL